MKFYKFINKLSMVWVAASMLLFFGVESSLNSGDTDIAMLLIFNLAASAITLISSATKVYGHE